MTEEATQNALMKTLDWAYEKALDPKIPGIESSYAFASDYSKGDDTLRNKVNSLIRWQNTKAGTSGFVTGIGGLLTLPVAVPANISSVLFIQIRMIAAIAIMGEHDPKDDKVQTLIYTCLCGNAAAEILKQSGIQLGNKLVLQAIKKIPGTVLTKINQRVGFRLVTKFGEKGIVNLGKTIPFVGGGVGAIIDTVATNAIGNVARDVFIGSNICSFCQKEFGTFERVYTCNNCNEIFCDDHCCNDSYVRHLIQIDPVIEKTVKESGYLCVNCLEKIKDIPPEWKESIISRTCSFPGCTESLSSVLTIKNSCKVCGRLFCSKHSTNYEEYAASWLKSNIKYQLADSVCKSCGENAEKI